MLKVSESDYILLPLNGEQQNLPHRSWKELHPTVLISGCNGPPFCENRALPIIIK